jgi:hypothetical protein
MRKHELKLIAVVFVFAAGLIVGCAVSPGNPGGSSSSYGGGGGAVATNFQYESFTNWGNTNYIGNSAFSVTNAPFITNFTASNFSAAFIKIQNTNLMINGAFAALLWSETNTDTLYWVVTRYTTGAFAYFTNNSVFYTNIGDTSLIVTYNCLGMSKELVVPAFLNGIPVTGIGNNAFSYTSLTSLTLPDSITFIGAAALYGCGRLTNLCFPNSLTNIGVNAFRACIALTNLILPSGLTTIENEAFIFCSGLTNLTLPNGLNSIGNSAFAACSGLKGLTLPVGLTSIGIAVFQGCTGLDSFSLPTGLSNIGDYAFWGCTGLTNITLPGGVTNIGIQAFKNCTSLKNLSMQSMTAPTVGDDAFSGVTGCTLHLRAGATGYNAAPWTNTSIFSSITNDLP